ncbi:MAG: formimidoylglutamate deiminase [Acidimicrobiia bacterium]|nr:formimidoylglutamate deiminase [Acidimicrobiia bacterium]
MSGQWAVDRAWVDGELVGPVTLTEADGRFDAVEPGAAGGATMLAGCALPGFANAHSHAFHRLLRGRTHAAGGDFWTWRDRMYEEAERLDPSSYWEVATAVFTEMALAGFTTVGEFHYLHHGPDGAPHPDPNAMGIALIDAARAAGLRISLLDAGYFTGSVGGRPLDAVQRRFSDSTAGEWLDRVADLASRFANDPDVVVGLAPHSVRAMTTEGLATLADRRDGERLHIHLSEQAAENEACLAEHGCTPTELLDRFDLLGPSTTAVHATHLTGHDIELLGSSGTTVCACPTTERDLADGLGPFAALAAAGSPLAIGTDSHASIDPFAEMRGIEMHERLASGARGHFSGTALLDAATTAGSAALGFPGGGLTVGSPADFVVVDTGAPRLAPFSGTVDEIVFGASAAEVRHVVVGGRTIVEGGRHVG